MTNGSKEYISKGGAESKREKAKKRKYVRAYHRIKEVEMKKGSHREVSIDYPNDPRIDS